MIDVNEFFREATLRICGNLQIEQALHATLLYLREYIPADHAFLNYYETGIGAYRTVATATLDEGTEVDLLTPMPPEARDKIRDKAHEYKEGRVIIDSAKTNPGCAAMLRCHGIEDSSVLRMTLMTEGGRLSSIVLTSKGEDCYFESHAELFSSLVGPFAIALSNVLHYREIIELQNRLSDDNRFLNRELLRISGDEIVGADFGLRDVMHQVRRVAPTESPVLLTGETGAGKDVIANAIHLGSPRRDGPFIAVNCGAITESLIDSELFGHEKGAFTGALSKKRGRFERADKGTIFLDEIGELPLQAQVRLLRVVQHREIERVGGTDRIPVDIRIIAATNQDFAQMVADGRFREDLFFRLNVFPIVVPPLRERTSDIPALVQFFLERKARELKVVDTPRLADGAIDALTAYSWPGNVRELENVLERAMILSHGNDLQFDDLDRRPAAGVPHAALRKEGEQPLDLDSFTSQHIRRVLNLAGGKIHGPGGAGELLGVNPNTLRYKMQKLGISFGKNKHAE